MIPSTVRRSACGSIPSSASRSEGPPSLVPCLLLFVPLGARPQDPIQAHPEVCAFRTAGAVPAQHPLRMQERVGKGGLSRSLHDVAVQKMAAAAEQLVVLVAEKGFVEELRGDIPVLIQNVRLVTVGCSGLAVSPSFSARCNRWDEAEACVCCRKKSGRMCGAIEKSVSS